MDLETLLNQLPHKKSESGGFSGLCLRFSPTKERWICAYGVARSKKPNKYIKQDKVGTGESPYEAVCDLIDKIKKWQNHN